MQCDNCEKKITQNEARHISNGKGGDIIKDNGSFVGCVKYENQAICYGDFIKEDFYSWSKLKVIGIQE